MSEAELELEEFVSEGLDVADSSIRIFPLSVVVCEKTTDGTRRELKPNPDVERWIFERTM